MAKNEIADTFSVESLIRSAFLRTKERFLSYLLAFLFLILVVAGVAIISGILGMILVLPFILSKNYVMATVWGSILGIAFLFAMIYLTTWLSLLLTQILIQDDKKGVVETFKALRPKVGGYLWLTILNGFFFFGLLPWGVLSIFIIYLLWGFWNSFTMFVYLKNERKGMANVWASRDMINSDFWGIFFRMAVVSLASVFISMALSATSKNNELAGLLSFIFNVVSIPFVISYRYEIFKHVKKVENPTIPKIWIALSIIGFVILIVGGYFLISALGSQAPSYLKQYQNPPSQNLPTI